MKKLSAFRFRNARFFMVLYSNHPNHLSFHSHFVTVFFQWYYMQSIVLIKNLLSSEVLTFGHKCFQNGLKQSLHDCEFSIGVEGGGSGLLPSRHNFFANPFFSGFSADTPLLRDTNGSFQWISVRKCNRVRHSDWIVKNTNNFFGASTLKFSNHGKSCFWRDEQVANKTK